MTTEATRIPRPVPRPGVFSRPFWEAARTHQFLMQRCARCEAWVFYPRYNCTACGSIELRWTAASGRGTVYTFTIARRPTHPALAAHVPYVIAIVELEEGPRMTTNIIGCAPESVRIGMAVEVAFEDVSDECTLVMFRPTPES